MNSNEFDQRLAGMHAHEQRMAASLNHALAKNRLLEKREADLERRVAQFAVREPLTYGRNSFDGHGESYFADRLRVATGMGKDLRAAQARLKQHTAEMEVEVPRRREARQRAADRAYEAAMTDGRAETRALQRMDRLGIARFEQRAISRTDGQGGYTFVPPIWLIEEYVNAPRPGRPFADLWQSLPLPAGTDSVNIPLMQVGTGAGGQSDLGAAPTRDITDNFASAQVTTVAGINPASMQWCEQSSPPGADEIVFRDLMEDADSQIDIQLLLGSSPFLNGVWPGGAVAQANGCLLANTNNGSTSAQTWLNGGTASSFNTLGCLYTTVAQAISLVNRARGLSPTHVVLPSWLWWSLCGTLDNNGRPLVQPTAHAPQVSATDGAAGTCWSLPCVLDDAIPTTFGSNPPPSLGGVTPALATISKGGGSYSPILIVKANDLYLWEGEITTEVFREVLAGQGQWLFRARRYAASTPSRYIAETAISISTSYTSGGVSAGGGISFGTVTQNESNGVTSLSGQGY